MLAFMLDESISKFVKKELIVASSELTVSDATKIMVESNVDSILVFEDDKVIGIITNKDILSNVVAKGIDPSKISVKKIMHSPLVKIHKDAKVREAIELMKKHDIRRLIVTDDKRTIGEISQKKIVGDMNDYAIVLPELETPRIIRCPYCDSVFDNKLNLSKHMDDIHIGKGLFEGNISRKNELGTI